MRMLAHAGVAPAHGPAAAPPPARRHAPCTSLGPCARGAAAPLARCATPALLPASLSRRAEPAAPRSVRRLMRRTTPAPPAPGLRVGRAAPRPAVGARGRAIRCATVTPLAAPPADGRGAARPPLAPAGGAWGRLADGRPGLRPGPRRPTGRPGLRSARCPPARSARFSGGSAPGRSPLETPIGGTTDAQRHQLDAGTTAPAPDQSRVPATAAPPQGRCAPLRGRRSRRALTRRGRRWRRHPWSSTEMRPRPPPTCWLRSPRPHRMQTGATTMPHTASYRIDPRPREQGGGWYLTLLNPAGEAWEDTQ